MTVRWHDFGALDGISFLGATQLSSEAAVRTVSSGNAYAIVGNDLVTRLLYNATRNVDSIR